MALTRVIMPKTGADMEEGRILLWKKKEGDRVEKGEVLLEIETDKATMEVESPESGVVLKRLFAEGEIVPATRLIAVLGDGNESPEEISEVTSGAEGPAPETSLPSAQAVGVSTPAPKPDVGGRALASPLARRLAQELGVDLASVQGTGPGGRIEKDDILKAAEARKPGTRD